MGFFINSNRLNKAWSVHRDLQAVKKELKEDNPTDAKIEQLKHDFGNTTGMKLSIPERIYFTLSTGRSYDSMMKEVDGIDKVLEAFVNKIFHNFSQSRTQSVMQHLSPKMANAVLTESVKIPVRKQFELDRDALLKHFSEDRSSEELFALLKEMRSTVVPVGGKKLSLIDDKTLNEMFAGMLKEKLSSDQMRSLRSPKMANAVLTESFQQGPPHQFKLDRDALLKHFSEDRSSEELFALLKEMRSTVVPVGGKRSLISNETLTEMFAGMLKGKLSSDQMKSLLKISDQIQQDPVVYKLELPPISEETLETKSPKESVESLKRALKIDSGYFHDLKKGMLKRFKEERTPKEFKELLTGMRKEILITDEELKNAVGDRLTRSDVKDLLAIKSVPIERHSPEISVELLTRVREESPEELSRYKVAYLLHFEQERTPKEFKELLTGMHKESLITAEELTNAVGDLLTESDVEELRAIKSVPMESLSPEMSVELLKRALKIDPVLFRDLKEGMLKRFKEKRTPKEFKELLTGMRKEILITYKELKNVVKNSQLTPSDVKDLLAIKSVPIERHSPEISVELLTRVREESPEELSRYKVAYLLHFEQERTPKEFKELLTGMRKESLITDGELKNVVKNSQLTPSDVKELLAITIKSVPIEKLFSPEISVELLKDAREKYPKFLSKHKDAYLLYFKEKRTPEEFKELLTGMRKANIITDEELQKAVENSRLTPSDVKELLAITPQM